MKSLRAAKLPTFVRCLDGKFYQDLVYQDDPRRRAWFIVFDDREPAEIVVRHDVVGAMPAREILTHRGFEPCLAAIMPGRKDPHKRFFGCERDVLTGAEKPIEGHDAVSWFLLWKRGVAFPNPNAFDSCAEIYSFFPNLEGVYFGDQK